MVLAEARGADVSAEAYELYATVLAEFADEDIRAVIGGMARSRRGEFEKPWPPLGDLIEPLRTMRRRRIEAQRATEDKEARITAFWQWADEWMKVTGNDEAELLDRFPTYRGTKPRG